MYVCIYRKNFKSGSMILDQIFFFLPRQFRFRSFSNQLCYLWLFLCNLDVTMSPRFSYTPLVVFFGTAGMRAYANNLEGTRARRGGGGGGGM